MRNASMVDVRRMTAAEEAELDAFLRDTLLPPNLGAELGLPPGATWGMLRACDGVVAVSVVVDGGPPALVRAVLDDVIDPGV